MSDSEILNLLSCYHRRLLHDAIRLSEAGKSDHAACREFGASVCAVLSAAVQSETVARQLLRDCERD
jgi:hypothetical protein